jgi:SH3-like domain-containing protein
MPTANIRKGEPYDVRIDRQTRYGNIYILGVHGTRPEVIAKFDHWARTSDDPAAVWIREHVIELHEKTVGCWCAPEACHGDVLLQMAKEAFDAAQDRPTSP